MTIHLLDNKIHNYAWGSKNDMRELFGIANPESKPQAELWMGVHPNGCSKLAGTDTLLSTFIDTDKTANLGTYTTARFGTLPFLFKVLSAKSPLSIQVHPNKINSEAGYDRENALGIPLGASNRNYKDRNHKPELVYALTPYKALNGFRPIENILQMFTLIDLPSLSESLKDFRNRPNNDGLKDFFKTIMHLEEKKRRQAINELLRFSEKSQTNESLSDALIFCTEFHVEYPFDVGVFSPLFLNTLHLCPGDAMFLHAETPHAYIKGTGLEIMANSDNVLRAGLTEKHIDRDELIANINFSSMLPERLLLEPISRKNKLVYPIPVDDFRFDILTSGEEWNEEYTRSAEIVFCIDGAVTIENNGHQTILAPGDSVFICNETTHYRYTGIGRLARAYN
ncbi:mannose-6-phosphate isomerase [Vibrio inusitatus NBRC 102082]|uniref:mannose-6-phosphate isomerase n=1 Tax=Vibrio inusitatus NBRC 102082 TaxID=1219070 RepID=A0A4Y3HYD4_9VIBR|nr:mannose-6-phosphate isomerase, class I [Vibrio inusitatus]GEA52117.1 mannose-6-phosphate isomerase [Vibrio inusitatus NBRC 102082]